MRKKALFSLLFAIALLLSIAQCAHAEARIDYVTDEAGILTADERRELRDRAEELSEKYGCGVYVVVVYDHSKYVNGNIETFAEEIFENYDLGYGNKRDGVLLVVSMRERDYNIYAHGDFGNYAFTDYGKTRLADTFLDDFRKEDWVVGVKDFLDHSGELIERARNGKPLDQWIADPAEPEPPLTPMEVLTSAIIAMIIAGSTVKGMKKQMKTAVKRTGAENYVPNGGVQLHGRSDEFVNRVVSRQVIPKNKPSNRPSGGHVGGTTISGSHGGSHHSGKY